MEFSFPGRWRVRKYDSHRFYQGLSSVGLKAVDFIVLTDAGELWLIEVKNYQPRQNGKKVFIPKIKSTDRLADSIHRKFRDSLRAIRIINQYYERNWFYRIMGPYLRRIGGPNSDWHFWREAFLRSEAAAPPRLLIWIELDGARKNYRTRLFATLLKHFEGEAVQLEMGFGTRNPLAGMQVSWPDPKPPESS